MLIRKINLSLWFCCIKKKMTIILKIKEGTRHRGQTNCRTRNGIFKWWFFNCGKVWWPCVVPLRCLASILSNVIRKVGSKRNFQFRWLFFKIQHLAFGNYLVVLNAIFGYVSAKTIPWMCFSLHKKFVKYLKTKVLGVCATLGGSLLNSTTILYWWSWSSSSSCKKDMAM